MSNTPKHPTENMSLPDGLYPDFPDAVVLDGMIRAGTPVIQAFLAILTGAPDG